MKYRIKLIFALILISLFFIVSDTVNGAINLNEGLVSYWSLDDAHTSGSTMIDQVNGYNGSISGATTGITAIINEGYNFTGGTHTSTVTHESDFASTNFSIAFWIMADFVGNDNAVFKDASGTNNGDWSFNTRDNDVFMLIFDTPVGGRSVASNTVIQNIWYHVIFMKEGSNTTIWVNGTLHDEESTSWDQSLNSNNFILGCDGGLLACYDGSLDEVGYWGRALNESEIEQLYNNGTGLAYPFTITPSPLPEPENTSFYLVEFNASDITFATNTYFDAFTFQYNVSPRMNVTFISSFNVVKNTGSGTNEIYGRIVTDEGTILSEELLRSVSVTGNEGSTGFFPILFEEIAGTHNLTFQFRRTGNGEVEINDIDFILMKLYTTQNQSVRAQLTQDSNTFTDTEFKPMANFTIDTVQTLVGSFAKVNINSTLPSYTNFRFQDDNSNGTGRIRRSLLSATEIGSVGIAQLDFVNYNGNFSLAMRTDSNPVSYNVSIMDFDLTDTQNNTVNIGSLTFNESTHTAGSNLLGNLNYSTLNGDSILVFGVASFNSSSGGQTPTFVINSSNTSLECYSKKERTLLTNQGVGNVYIFTVCNSGLVINETYQFNMYAEVETGETLNIEGGGFATFEVSEFDVSLVPTEKTMDIETNLINNTINYNNDTLEIYYNFTIGIFNTIDQADCDLIFNEVVNDTQLARNDSTNYLFNLSTADLEQDLNISIDCNNSEVSTSSGIFFYKIDAVQPRIESDFVNNTQYFTGNTVTFNVNFTDPNLFAYNVSWFDINGLEVQNFFVQNLTSGFEANTSSYVVITVTNGSIRAQAWDSHTDNKVRDINWYWLNNKLYGADIAFEGDFKRTDSQGNLITYFYHVKDRYKLKVTFNDKKLYHSFNITANGWQYIGNLHGYKGHFVNLGTKRWMDFQGNNVQNVEVTNLGEGKFNIEVELKSSNDEVEFESIGDLNFNEITFEYTVIDSGALNTILLEQLLEAQQNQTTATVQVSEQQGGIFMYVIIWLLAFIILILCLILFKNLFLFYIGLPISVMLVFLGVSLFDTFTTLTDVNILLYAMYSIQWIYLLLVVVAIFFRATANFIFGTELGKKDKKSDLYEEFDY